ncbi:hypothetical protein K7W42_20320 [Deinococcus sp. HMF7604]|uniref:hypothetical protein n=1 Tax=Deinococcus betulae TaxID=2873312 RepID=UPI001CD0172B|nr:hypothetical protein [Deinococcus betulae]MBZ9753185.1 hypothetical protein [Deinococcus betulae]
MNRTTSTLGTPAFIADLHSITLWGTGAQIDWTAWTDAKYGTAGKRKVPAGTVIAFNASGKIVPPTVNAGAVTNGPCYLARTDMEEDSRVAALSGFGVITGGNVYDTLLPDAAGNPRSIAAELKTALGARFVLQPYGDAR